MRVGPPNPGGRPLRALLCGFPFYIRCVPVLRVHGHRLSSVCARCGREL